MDIALLKIDADETHTMVILTRKSGRMGFAVETRTT
jgi:hypothetical protein